MDKQAALRLETYDPWLADRAMWPSAAARLLPEPLVDRSARLDLERDRVTLLVGPRQAGKTTLVWSRLVELDAPPPFLDLDDPLLREPCASGGHFVETLSSRGCGHSSAGAAPR